MSERNETLQEDDALMRAARALPQASEPPRDLWPGIEAAINAAGARTVRRWPRWLAQAAAVVLLAGGSSAVTWFALERSATGVPVNGQPMAGLEFEMVAGNIGNRYHLGPAFVDARAELASGLDEKIAQLPPQTRLAVEQNIADIRAAIAEINRALADQPDNRLLQDLLMSAYREELDLMRKVDTIARRSAMHRTDI